MYLFNLKFFLPFTMFLCKNSTFYYDILTSTHGEEKKTDELCKKNFGNLTIF